MQFKTVSAAAGPYDAALRVLPAGAPVRFCDQALQAAWQAHFGGDPLTLEHRQVLTLRLPLLGGFTTLLLAGFDAGVPAPMDGIPVPLGPAGRPSGRVQGVQCLSGRTERIFLCLRGGTAGPGMRRTAPVRVYL